MAATRMHESFSDPGLQYYLAAIAKFPLLTREQEIALARRYLNEGEQEAAHRLVQCNLRFVVKIAIGFRGYGLKVSDLIEEGNLGLLEAVKRFDPERGRRFMTYAAFWIRAYILAYVLKSWSMVGVGTGPLQSKLFFRLQRERARIAARLGSGVDVERRLARKFGTSEERIREMAERLDRRDSSLDAVAFRDGTVTVLDMLPDHGADQEARCGDAERDRVVRQRVVEALAEFEAREVLIVRKRLLTDEPETLAELGRTLGLSRERVRQLEERVKAKLRRVLGDLQGEVAEAA
ncbi:MAG TPA: RNA polymerase factor sigma-32 [Polyangia bacterium]|nr:RNA polymerase factor sigma-32 [Polyangia bacterium]